MRYKFQIRSHRWIRQDHVPQHGETRTVRRFLFRQVVIFDQKRWLEWATINQRYDEAYGWLNVNFVDTANFSPNPE